ncbi:MAG: septal ring lytic transglycosylase RlpA family protein [Treponema sp.]|nr:septal ring lytic transglycosylase RlpA family protein [Treponema sp.]
MEIKKGLILIFLIALCSNVFALSVYKQKVTASYYAEQFHGKRTSNGEYFNMYSLTCAHKSLPFDTVIRVTNLSNGKQVDVRVNDRGPFVVGREIDLSKAAAVKLDMIKSGTAKVRLEIVKMGPNTKLSVQTAAKAKLMMAKLEGNTSTTTNKTNTSSSTSKPVVRAAGTYWDIQVGAFSSKENANKRAQSLKKAGFKDVVFQTVKSTGVVRVVIKAVPAEKVAQTEKELKNKGFYEYTIRQRKE